MVDQSFANFDIPNMRFLQAAPFVKAGLLTAIALPAIVVAADVAAPSDFTRRHAHVHQKKHDHSSDNAKPKLEKRGSCSFPGKGSMVAVAKGEMNGGWALPPDQPCEVGMYCPYACPPGYLMGQWDPEATAYTYPMSMNGGLRCGQDGEVSVPFPEKPMCYEGHGTFLAKNSCSESVAICQTVLPGREDMLIPSVVNPGQTVTLAVPGTEYWCGTAAHYYINPPGVSARDGCIWGSTANPHGNWAPYVAGANIDDAGNTYTKIGWNPIYLEPATPFRNERPDWGVEIICEEGGNCSGLPCRIDPSVDAVNSVNGKSGGQSTGGAGGANFCVVTAQKGSKAIMVTFPAGKSGTTSGSGSGDVGSVKIAEASPESSSSPPPPSTTTTTTQPPTTTSEPPSTTAEPTTTTESSTTTTESSTTTSTTTTESSTSTSESSTSSSSSSSDLARLRHKVHNNTSTRTSPVSHSKHRSSSHYTPTLTPVNQGISNVTADASMYTDVAPSTVNTPPPASTSELRSAAAAFVPSVFALGLAAIAHVVLAL
ncbi:hypothetical protein Dda_8778 [Drechslerella dactyloides]|uniref:Uncharacterized protein n=1 Tax=Drechslerella dactyloides TaxID=74499 RepID=A0AAD6IQ60_DREDA|nr:hypothetical protein Dda_8778 [Drechslerella dactyloides]